MNENVAHEVQDLAARCKEACSSYTRVSAELATLLNEQHTIVNKHEDLLVRASFELRDVVERCSEAQQQLLGHLQALCTKADHVNDLSTKVKALKADVQSLLSLMQAYVQKHPQRDDAP